MATLRAETLQAPIALHLLATFWDNDQLAPVESLKAAGAWGWTLSPMAPIPWRALSEALPYLKALGGSIFLLPFWEAIAEEVGVPAQPLLALSGWRGTPEAAEVLAIRLLGEIHRLYGGNLHIGPLTTQKGLHAARAEGLPTFTALPYLLFSAERLLSYNPTWKFHPPLRSPGDQAALWKALGKGDIPLLASYHEAIPPEDKNHPWSEAAPGMPLLPQAASLFFSLAEQYGLPLEVAVTVWALQPRQYLGLPLPTLSVGQPLRHVLLRPLPEPKLWHDLQLSYELSPAVPSGA
jgi:dihydroorotase